MNAQTPEIRPFKQWVQQSKYPLFYQISEYKAISKININYDTNFIETFLQKNIIYHLVCL